MVLKREVCAKTTALLVDGSYARIQARELGGKLDFVELRAELEELTSTEFEECWYFDSLRFDGRGDSALSKEYQALKLCRPDGPQFHVEVFSTKPYNCHCTACGHKFTQNVQKGVDNGIATKLLTLTLLNHVDRVVLLSGDGDFYSTLRYLRYELRKEVWVVGYRGTVSGDLQQLASKMVWLNEMWDRVRCGRRGRETSRVGERGSEVHHRSGRQHRARRDKPKSRTRRVSKRGGSKSRRRETSPARSHRRTTSRLCNSPTSRREVSRGRRDTDSGGRRLVSAQLRSPTLGKVEINDGSMSAFEDENDYWPCSPLSLSPLASVSLPGSRTDPETPSSLDGKPKGFPLAMAVPSVPKHGSPSPEREQRSFRLASAVSLPAATTTVSLAAPTTAVALPATSGDCAKPAG